MVILKGTVISLYFYWWLNWISFVSYSSQLHIYDHSSYVLGLQWTMVQQMASLNKQHVCHPLSLPLRGTSRINRAMLSARHRDLSDCTGETTQVESACVGKQILI